MLVIIIIIIIIIIINIILISNLRCTSVRYMRKTSAVGGALKRSFNHVIVYVGDAHARVSGPGLQMFYGRGVC